MEYIKQKLLEIGGVVKDGKYAGQPVYRLEWGETATTWLRGKHRIRFRDLKKPIEFTQQRFFVAPEIFQRVADALATRNRVRAEHFVRTGVLTDTTLSELLENESPLNYMRLPDANGTHSEIKGNFEFIAKSAAPKDWLYLTDLSNIREQGKPFWYVTKWIEAKHYTSEETWNAQRYSYDAYVPELGMRLPVIDDFGEYPKDGEYVAVLEIADYTDPDNPVTAEPTYSNCIEPILEFERSREAMTAQDADPDWRYKQKEEYCYEKADEGMKLQSEYSQEIFGEAIEKTKPKKIQIAVP